MVQADKIFLNHRRCSELRGQRLRTRPW